MYSNLMSRPLDSTHCSNLGKILSNRSSSTRTVVPVISTGSSLSVDSHASTALNAATAPPASLSRTPLTSAVADVFSKSVTITALISGPSACISDCRMSRSASYFADPYAITLPTGEAQALAPPFVIWIPSILSFFFASSARAWSSLLSDLIRPFLMYRSSSVISVSMLFPALTNSGDGVGMPSGSLRPPEIRYPLAASAREGSLLLNEPQSLALRPGSERSSSTLASQTSSRGTLPLSSSGPLLSDLTNVSKSRSTFAM